MQSYALPNQQAFAVPGNVLIKSEENVLELEFSLVFYCT